MKRALFPGSVLALLTLLACSIGWAAPVTNDMVMTVASRWAYAVKTPSGTLRQPVAARPVKNASGVAAFYIVDLAPPGYVIIAADDRAEPVIFFNTDSKAPNLDDPQSPLRSMLFTEVDTRMKAAESFTQVQQVKVASLWGAGTRDPAFYTIVTDEMLTTRWNQHGTRVVAGTPNMNTFNLYTPGGRPAGCGPVAMSQVIRYYRYPAAVRGTGTYHVGGWFPWNVETSSYDAHFNYDQMPDWVNNNSTDDEIRNVASLLAVAGMSSSVIYTASNTAALPGPMLNSFRGTFGYSAGWASGTGLLGSDDATIRTAMQNEITNGFPALLSIRPNFMEIDSAHIVVADGYGTYTHDATVDQVFHINMGWGGSADGWYVVPGFSAGGHAWRTITGIFYGIRPPEIRRVDVQARSAQMAIDEYNGVDTYSNIGQVTPNTLVRASTASAARFEIKIKNNGTWPEIYTLKCSDPDATATARYFVDGIDITSDVKSVAGWRTPRLSAGRTLTVEMQVTVTSALALGVQKNFSFRATSTG
ncbi:MAG: C10 family peptidase, partial [bacterium]